MPGEYQWVQTKNGEHLHTKCGKFFGAIGEDEKRKHEKECTGRDGD